jgi:predicted acylesterase/phospholipase RssA
MPIPKKRTRFFQTCLGVFQGGGCRGAAFVGALEELEQRKVDFAGVAGTSAGSITAALIGAGANSDYLQRAVGGLDFLKEFLVPPENVVQEREKLITRLGFGLVGLLSDDAANAVSIVRHHGLYSSEGIENWLNKQLHLLLPDKKPPIRFKDLPVPTYIVAADIRTNDVKIWSSLTTQDDEVAYAVRCSCSIPGFFQPVHGRYIDGGVLSNLPAFVFSGEEFGQIKPFANRILAFTLVSSHEDRLPKTGRELLKATVNTVVDGATAVQGRIIEAVHQIAIDTEEVQATDFDKMNPTKVARLSDQGRVATAKFFDDELSRVATVEQSSALLYGNDEIYLALTEALDDLNIKHVVICDSQAKWAYAIYPTLLAWRLRGVKLQVVLNPGFGGSDHEMYRRRLLRAMGAELYFSDALPFSGFLLNPDDQAHARGIVFSPDLYTDETVATRYKAPYDFTAIKALWQITVPLMKLDANKLDVIPSLRRASELKILEDLKRFVPAYSTAKAQLRMETVPLDSLTLLTRFVRGFKFKQIQHLFDLFTSKGFSCFEPAEILYTEALSTVVTPPVVEYSGSRYIVVQGNTRALYCYKNDMPELRCIVVRDLSTPLPSNNRVGLKEVLIGGRTLSTIERYSGPIDQDYRSIEMATHHPGQTLLDAKV